MSRRLWIAVGFLLLLSFQNCSEFRGQVMMSKGDLLRNSTDPSQDGASAQETSDDRSDESGSAVEQPIPEPIPMTVPMPLPESQPPVQSGESFWKEDFESGAGQWGFYDGAGPGSIEVVEGEAHTGSKSLRMHFTDLNVGAGPFIDRTFPTSRHVFLRYWIKADPGFQYSNISTKLVYSPRGNGYPSCLTVTQGNNSAWFTCQGEGYPDGFYAVGWDRANGYSTVKPGIPKDGSWICHESEVDIDGGVIRFWINDQLIGEERGDLKNTGHAEPMYLVRMYRERGIGNLYFDDFAVGSERQGCD